MATNHRGSRKLSTAPIPADTPPPSPSFCDDGHAPISSAAKHSAKPLESSSGVSSKTPGTVPRVQLFLGNKNVQDTTEPTVNSSTSLSAFANSSHYLSPITPSSFHEIPAMSQEARPKLKLSFSKLNVNQSNQNTPKTPSAAQDGTRTPSLKLKIKTPAAPTPTAPPAATPSSTKSKKPKSTPKLAAPTSSAKKRKKPHKDGEGDSSADELHKAPQKIKKIRFLQKPKDEEQPTPVSATTPTLKIKYKGKVPKRPLGVGYDSELSDRENDPTIAEAFMFRMPPGPDCDYLQHAVENNLIGLPIREGGADIKLQFWDRHGRRAMVTIRGHRYAASVVDLPCIIEGMKSWDKKGWIKSADISQMILILGPVESEEESQNYPLPPEVDPKTFQYAHGMTPPMQWVRKRRFARTKRTSLSAIEAVERKVNQLLADDEAAEDVKWEIIDHDTFAREEYDREPSIRPSYDEDMEGYDDEDAEGEDIEEDYFGRARTNGYAGDTPAMEDADMDDDAIAAELEAHLMDSDEEEEDDGAGNATPATELPAPRPQISSAVPDDSSLAITSASASPSVATAAATTPAAAATPSAATTSDADVSDGESGSSDEDEDDSDDEAAAARREQREKIAELEDSIRAEEEKFKGMQNPILKKKIQIQIGKLRADLEMAKRGAGIGDDGGDD